MTNHNDDGDASSSSLERGHLMGAIPTEPEARRAYFAALGRVGGAATLEKYGASHFYVIRNRPATGLYVALLLEKEWNAARDKW